MKKALLPTELKTLEADQLFVSEFFLSIQGETTHAGRPCFFVRLTGCHLRCTWCDTAYSFFDGQHHRIADCVARAKASGAPLVQVTGGEPLLQPASLPLMTALCDEGFEVLVETSGAVDIRAVDPRVRRIVDWKCPGSAMADHNRPDVLSDLRDGDELKLVLLDRRDYEWGRDWVRANRERIPDQVPVHFSPVFDRLPYEELAAWVLEDQLNVRLNLQIHKWIWDPQQRGV